MPVLSLNDVRSWTKKKIYHISEAEDSHYY